MTVLQKIIKTHDKPGTIILLEGKRNVPEADQEKLIALGKLLALNTKHIIFRSGNAPGADYLFCSGVASVDSTRLEVIVPYKNHRKKENLAYRTVDLDGINLTNEPAAVYQSRSNKKTSNLVDKYVAGVRNQFTVKASYIIRDTIKVIGARDIAPANFAVFYDDLTNPKAGGTGHTMKICEMNGIEYIDQRTWMKWLE